MGKDLLFNGHRYTPVDPSPESQAIAARFSDVVDHSTISTRLDGQPAILHNGQPYLQGERVVPGSSIDWGRIRKGG